VLVFASDHVYKMDVGDMLEQHRRTEADITIAVVPVPSAEAHQLGCVAVDASGRVTGFLEKPANPPEMPGRPGLALASLGNYIFRTPALLEELRRCVSTPNSRYDFGADIMATCHERLRVHAYDFSTHLCPGETQRSRGYWRDVGTLDAYHAASMDLVSVHPHLDLYNEAWPIRGAQSACGPAKFVFSDEAGHRVGAALDSIVGAGTIVSGGLLKHVVCSEKVRVHSYAHVEESVLFPEVEIGRGARLRRCIVDKGVRVPEGTVIGYDTDADRARYAVSEGGVVVVTRGAIEGRDEIDIIRGQTGPDGVEAQLVC
jgi:glucose-1-phosphate adenylyltransferase